MACYCYCYCYCLTLSLVSPIDVSASAKNRNVLRQCLYYVDSLCAVNSKLCVVYIGRGATAGPLLRLLYCSLRSIDMQQSAIALLRGSML
jgi:hypothetical protein